jgi:hypothetical protein
MAYGTVDALRERMRIPDTVDDSRLSALLDVAAEMIDTDTGRTFGQTTATKTFIPTDSYCLVVPPIVTVTTLKTDDNEDGTYETTWAASDYVLDGWSSDGSSPLEQVRAIGSRLFPIPSSTGRQRLVQIAGVWGYTATPNAIIEANLLLASRLWHRAGSPLGVQSFGDIGATYVRNSDPDYMALIRHYIRIGVA